LWTYKDITYKLGGNDHEDPLGYLKNHGVSESQFHSDVLKVYNGHLVSVKEKPQQQNEIPGVVNPTGVAYINGDNVNLRFGPSTSNSVIRKLSYRVEGRLGNWLNLGGNQWIYYNSSYIRYEEEQSTSISGKRVISKMDNLRFYDTPSWQDQDVAGTVVRN
jgi:hypothetical protein